MEVIAKEYRVSFGGDENILNLILVMVLHKPVKIPKVIY